MAKRADAIAERKQRFVDEYLVDLNATRAAIRAGYSERTAKQQGSRLLTNVDIAAAIARARAAQSERLHIEADDVVRRWWTIANADPRELTEYRRGCCRFCYGKNFRYQFTPAEMAKARGEFEAMQSKKSKEEFDEHGGLGFNRTKPPHPECPECSGEGIARAYFRDTRNLSPAAVSLYSGVKVTKDGTEIILRDQDGALANVAKHLGLFVEKAPEAPDNNAVASAVREAVRAMLDADGLRDAA